MRSAVPPGPVRAHPGGLPGRHHPQLTAHRDRLDRKEAHVRCGLSRSYVALGFAVVAAAGAVGGGGWPASAGLVRVPARIVAAPVTAAPQTLTVRGIDAAGHPDTGDGVVVANVDNPKAFGDSQNAFGAFHDGIATF